jgi:CheY-like chemotaxis protein
MCGAGSVILYVEDEESDRILMELAFARQGLGKAIRLVSHGQAAIDYLSGDGPYANRESFPLPAVVLLDLNLPEVHGFDVLHWVRSSPEHQKLPVVIFTSSPRDDDRRRAQVLGATDFVQKPNSPAVFQDVVRSLRDRWLTPPCPPEVRPAAPARAPKPR